MHARIIGAGIGGLSCAIALARDGWQVDVHERSAKLEEVGAGLQLGPNVTRLLADWELLEAARALAFQPQNLIARDWGTDGILSRFPLKDASNQSRWGAPYLQIHRADLQELLATTLASLPNVRLHLSSAVGPSPLTASGLQANDEAMEADLIIGADGIRSVVRPLVSPSAQPHYTGHSAWRLLIPVEALGSTRPSADANLWLGPGKHLVSYYVRGGQSLNCVGVVERPWDGGDWTQATNPDELLGDFSDACPLLKHIASQATPEAFTRWSLFDLPALPRWSKNNVVLLGDAAHATLPFVAQGAAMAIEDAWALAASLRMHKDLSNALTRYEELRKPRTQWIQSVSRRNGRIYHLRGLMARARNATMRSGLASPAKLAHALYAYDVRKCFAG